MLSVELAKQLRRAGLTWRPSRFDFFHIPDRDLDDETFVIADLTIDVFRLADGIAAITFSGATEWALDYILTQDVVWLPTEEQLRDMLGDCLVSLEPSGEGFRCTITHHDVEHAFEAGEAADAYGLALLHCLRGEQKVSAK